MSTQDTRPAEGWYPSPDGGPGTRWWDGHQWTDRTGPPPPQGGAVVYDQPRRKRSWGKILLVVTLVFIAMIVGCVALVSKAADEVSDDIEASDAAALADVERPGCRPGPVGWTADGNVTNSSSKRSDYSIEVKAVTATGVQMGSGVAFVPNVEPGQEARYEALIPGVAAGLALRCELVDVTRTASV